MPFSATVSRSAPRRLPRVYRRFSIGTAAAAAASASAAAAAASRAVVRHLAPARPADRERRVLVDHGRQHDHRVAPGADRGRRKVVGVRLLIRSCSPRARDDVGTTVCTRDVQRAHRFAPRRPRSRTHCSCGSTTACGLMSFSVKQLLSDSPGGHRRDQDRRRRFVVLAVALVPQAHGRPGADDATASSSRRAASSIPARASQA